MPTDPVGGGPGPLREAGGPGTEGYHNSPIRVGCTRLTGDDHGRTAADAAQCPSPNEVDPTTVAPSTLRGLDFLCTTKASRGSVHKKTRTRGHRAGADGVGIGPARTFIAQGNSREVSR